MSKTHYYWRSARKSDTFGRSTSPGRPLSGCAWKGAVGCNGVVLRLSAFSGAGADSGLSTPPPSVLIFTKVRCRWASLGNRGAEDRLWTPNLNFGLSRLAFTDRSRKPPVIESLVRRSFHNRVLRLGKLRNPAI